MTNTETPALLIALDSLRQAARGRTCRTYFVWLTDGTRAHIAAHSGAEARDIVLSINPHADIKHIAPGERL